MKLIKKNATTSTDQAARSGFPSLFYTAMDRRTFLRRSGLTAGAAAVGAALAPTMMRKAQAEPGRNIREAGVVAEIKRSVCSHCSVGCGVVAEVQNGVWTGQEPDFDSPFNLGGHCAKGAALREHGVGEKRIKYPMKLEGGRWKRISWDDAINEIGDQFMKIREESGPDSVWWCGSSKASNEGSYLQRKFVAFWGTNNIDHQARICHSTTVAGVANTWGYGAMTNSYNDMHNSKCMFFIGSNAAEAHPVAMQHILRAKENGAKMIVADPRFTRTAAHADQHISFRSGTDVPLIWGMLWHIFENGWEDRQYINQRVYGLDKVREEVAHWTPARVEDVTGVPEAQVYEAAKTMAEHRPGTLVWCMGGTQHHVGTNNTRAYCILQLALGNIGVAGGGANIFRGHCNVQGATDVGPNSHTLPGYYGLAEGAWRHWCRVWDVDFDYIKSRFDDGQYDAGGGNMAHPMNIVGIPVSRWIDGILEDPSNLSQRANTRAVFFQGHAVNSQVRGPDMKEAVEKLDLVVISDPYPTHLAVMSERTDGVYLLPTCTQFEQSGSITASNRSLQWREQVIEPLFESKTDAQILYRLAQKFGFEDQMFKNIAIEGADWPSSEDTLREINRGTWTIGYTGQSPERLKLHLENKHTFDTTTLRAVGGPCDGDYYGLPWPCWGTPEMNHPGTHVLYDPSLPVKDGGLTFRARFGVEREGESLLANGSFSEGSELRDGYPEFYFRTLRQLGWHVDLTREELEACARVAGVDPSELPRNIRMASADVLEKLDGVNWKTDLSGGIQRVVIAHGCAPFGNAKARCEVWQFPDPIPVHREPLYTPRYDLVAEYPTYEDAKATYRLPTRYASVQSQDYSQDFPLVFSSGRLVEYEGGGEETRSNKWLAELQQEMFVEIHPGDANDRNIVNGQDVWLDGPEGGSIRVQAMVTERVPRGTVWTPFHFGGHFQGKDLLDRYPEGTAPHVRGEACNTATTYGYDRVTQMQETKTTLCQIRAA